MSQQSIPILTLSPLATEDITAHRFVAPGGAVPGAGENTLGASLADTSTGQPIPTTVLGTAIVEAGGTFSAYDKLETDAEGKAVVLDTGIAAAMALQDGVDGRYVEVLLIQN